MLRLGRSETPRQQLSPKDNSEMKLRSKQLDCFPFTFQNKLDSKCILISVLPGFQKAAGEEKQSQTNAEKHFGDLHSFKYLEGSKQSNASLEVCQ